MGMTWLLSPSPAYGSPPPLLLELSSLHISWDGGRYKHTKSLSEFPRGCLISIAMEIRHPLSEKSQIFSGLQRSAITSSIRVDTSPFQTHRGITSVDRHFSSSFFFLLKSLEI